MTRIRDLRAAQARETVTILERGTYTSPNGVVVDLREEIARAVTGTVEYAPDADLPSPAATTPRVRIEVTPEGTFEAARRLRDENPVVLNFASAKHPGGGFLGGAQAQEEALARDSALYVCIKDRGMYRINRSRDTLYSDAMIHSPEVPVIRDGDGTLLDEPWLTAIITAPAPNAGVWLERNPGGADLLEATLRERARRVLAVAHRHGHDSLVLGAWGCGVFRNDPTEVATVFRDLLAGPFAGAFGHVVFAILDRTRDQRALKPFQEVLTA
ncbi:MAG: TIGR02452 family protein [Arachnia propionica]|uniref:TIGR02452 family protein n=1 Tax=Arachnia propionica TaxID=1750 RepID=UPI00270DC445|nr:TIGR02452 family protein [Arachnia propionica]